MLTPRRERGVALGDVLLKQMHLDIVKGFLGMKLKRVNDWVRWDSSTFLGNQFRLLTDNVKMAFDEKAVFKPSEGETEEARQKDFRSLHQEGRDSPYVRLFLRDPRCALQPWPGLLRIATASSSRPPPKLLCLADAS